MKNLGVKIQGVRGGNPQYKEKVGYVTTFFPNNNNRISVDNFEGYGTHYKQREEALITIQIEGDLLFEGTKQELAEKLKK